MGSNAEFNMEELGNTSGLQVVNKVFCLNPFSVPKFKAIGGLNVSHMNIDIKLNSILFIYLRESWLALESFLSRLH